MTQPATAFERAVKAANGPHVHKGMGDGLDGIQLGMDSDLGLARTIVRAVLEAIREPDPGMMFAGADGLIEGTNVGSADRARDAWRAMIDKLLEQG